MRVCPRCSIETDETVCPVDGAITFAVQAGQETYPPGEVLAGRYQVDAVLGVGGFGAVYKCTQLAMNQVVAVKVLRNEHLSSVEHVKRFTREAQAVSKLKHPNTIHTFDFGTHSDGALYLAMEYLEGETLADRLDANGVIYWETLVRIATQICHSLTEAHALGLVHRDLKPENIMLIPVAGDPNFVKVLDFGIAKMQKDPSKPGEASLTEAGMIMGTPTYMSPEQAKGEGIEASSDVYSLGVMMYEALTGMPPFHDETAMKVLVAHIKDPPKPFPRTGATDEPPFELERVVLQCLEKEPEMRPQTTTQLVDRLVTAARRARDSASFSAVVIDKPTMMVPAVETATVATPAAQASRFAVPLTPLSGLAVDTELHAAAPEPESRMPLYIAVGAFAAVAVGAVIALVVAGHAGNDEPPAVPTLTNSAIPLPAQAVSPVLAPVVALAAPLAPAPSATAAAVPATVLTVPATALTVPATVLTVPATALTVPATVLTVPPSAPVAPAPTVAAPDAKVGAARPAVVTKAAEPKAQVTAKPPSAVVIAPTVGPAKPPEGVVDPAHAPDAKLDDKGKRPPHHDDFRLEDDKTDK